MSDCFETLLGLHPEGWNLEPAASSNRGMGAALSGRWVSRRLSPWTWRFLLMGA